MFSPQLISPKCTLNIGIKKEDQPEVASLYLTWVSISSCGTLFTFPRIQDNFKYLWSRYMVLWTLVLHLWMIWLYILPVQNNILRAYEKYFIGCSRLIWPSKIQCSFLKTTVVYLGHVLSPDGIKTQQDKVNAMRKVVPPTMTNHLKSILDSVVFYWNFILNFSAIATLLNELTKRGRSVSEWDDDCSGSF